MTASATTIDRKSAANMLRWWLDMGVDTLVDESPVAWLERGKAAAPKVEAIKAEASLPGTLPAFIEWLKTSPDIPAGGPPERRLTASGRAGADLMIVTDMPGPGDVEAEELLGGEVGEMFGKMLRSIRWSRETTYIAALSPARPPTGMIAAADLPELGKIALHHIALAAPKQLWLMGEAVSRAILGMEMAKARGILHQINQQNGTVTAVASFSPQFLFRNPRRKADAWADMQLLQKGIEA